VNEYLISHGVKGITPKKALVKNNLAADIVKNFAFAAHANVKIVGATAVITIMRAENVVVNNAEIVSPVDGVIFDITVFSGVANFAPGKIVHAGDILVSGARPMAIIKIANGNEIIYEFNNTNFKPVGAEEIIS
jgi:hypothetical protein